MLATDGSAAKSAGMAQTLAAENLRWQTIYLQFIAWYAAMIGRPFLAEEVRAEWIKRGNPEPHRSCVYGAMMNAAAKRKFIRKTGVFVPAAHVRNHAHHYAQWVKA